MSVIGYDGHFSGKSTTPVLEAATVANRVNTFQATSKQQHRTNTKPLEWREISEEERDMHNLAH